jgi:hypothetical protein
LRHRDLDVKWGAWASLTLWLAPLPLLAHALVFVLLRGRPEYPPLMIGVSLVTAAVMVSWLFYGNRANLRAIPPAQRRRYMSIWAGTFIGMILVALTIWRLTHPTTPEEWFIVYVFWPILVGCTFCSLAATTGVLYVTAGLCFLLALLAPFMLYYMPLVVGVLMSLNMTTLGLILRRVAREAREARETTSH